MVQFREEINKFIAATASKKIWKSYWISPECIKMLTGNIKIIRIVYSDCIFIDQIILFTNQNKSENFLLFSM